MGRARVRDLRDRASVGGLRLDRAASRGFAPWVFARSGAGVVQSLGDSARLVKGRFLGLLGRLLPVGLVCIPFALVPLVGWLLGAAWALCAWGLLYEDLRQPAPATVAPSATRPLRTKRATV